MVNELLEKIADDINDLCQQINLVHLKTLRIYINGWNSILIASNAYIFVQHNIQ